MDGCHHCNEIILCRNVMFVAVLLTELGGSFALEVEDHPLTTFKTPETAVPPTEVRTNWDLIR